MKTHLDIKGGLFRESQEEKTRRGKKRKTEKKEDPLYETAYGTKKHGRRKKKKVKLKYKKNTGNMEIKGRS